MLENSEQIFCLIDRMKATVLIAGSSKRMPQDVMAVLGKIVKENLKKQRTEVDSNDDEQALKKLSCDYIENLERMNRIQLETWA